MHETIGASELSSCPGADKSHLEPANLLLQQAFQPQSIAISALRVGVWKEGSRAGDYCQLKDQHCGILERRKRIKAMALLVVSGPWSQQLMWGVCLQEMMPLCHEFASCDRTETFCTSHLCTTSHDSMISHHLHSQNILEVFVMGSVSMVLMITPLVISMSWAYYWYASCF